MHMFFPPGKIRFSLFKKASSSIKLNASVLEQAGKVCGLYNTCFSSLKEDVKTDVLIGLGCNGALVSKMWHFLWLSLGLDVEKIVRAAAATGVGKVAGGSAKVVGSGGKGSGSSKGVAVAVGVESREGGGAGLDPVFSVLTLCCQTTLYRLM